VYFIFPVERLRFRFSLSDVVARVFVVTNRLFVVTLLFGFK